MKKVKASKIDWDSWFLGAVIGYATCFCLKVLPMKEEAIARQPENPKSISSVQARNKQETSQL